jgi:sigma-E factor negative regulatory protein RseC
VGKEKEVRALNPAGARVGDRILLGIDTGPFLKATFLLYLFPILCLIAGALSGQWAAGFLALDASTGAAAAGFGCFVAAMSFVRIRGNRLARDARYQPKILRVLGRS